MTDSGSIRQRMDDLLRIPEVSQIEQIANTQHVAPSIVKPNWPNREYYAMLNDYCKQLQTEAEESRKGEEQAQAIGAIVVSLWYYGVIKPAAPFIAYAAKRIFHPTRKVIKNARK